MQLLVCTKKHENLYKAKTFSLKCTLIHLSYNNRSLNQSLLKIHSPIYSYTSLFTGVSVLFNKAKLEQYMLHFKLWKRLLLMGNISVRTVLQHEWSSLSLRFTRIVTKKVFIHRIAASSSAIHKQASVREIMWFYSSLLKRVIAWEAWERSRAASGYGIVWGYADRNKQEEFSAECHSVDWI